MTIENNLKIIKLIDTYGKLLTDKQFDIVSTYYFDNLSLSEIGDIFNISRQAVSDSLNKSIKSLLDYENKLKFIDKSKKINDELNELKSNFTDDKLNIEIDKIINLLY